MSWLGLDWYQFMLEWFTLKEHPEKNRESGLRNRNVHHVEKDDKKENMPRCVETVEGPWTAGGTPAHFNRPSIFYISVDSVSLDDGAENDGDEGIMEEPMIEEAFGIQNNSFFWNV